MELAVIDKVPMISLGEPPGAELRRWATDQLGLIEFRVRGVA
jgi:hypothetical protein